MANLILNGTTFSGLPNGTGNASAWQPTSITLSEHKVGMTLVAADGTRNRVERSVTKRVWKIDWQGTNAATINTLRTLQRLYTTWTLTDLDALSWTAQTEDDDLEPEYAFTSSAGALYWNVKLTVFQV